MALSLDTLERPESPAAVRLPASAPALPREQRLGMPTQSLARWTAEDQAAAATRREPGTPWLARLLVYGGATALTIYGAREMYFVVSIGRTTVLQYVLLALFVVNFSWIALAFSSAVVGFCKLAFARRAPGLSDRPLAARTAIVMPVYNELTARTFAAVEAIRASVEATGKGEAFDYFILSDSTNPDAWLAEERAFLALRDRIGPGARLYYRHREKNHHRKAGNIADFVTRWGGAYAHMIVLDADSLMTGPCIVALAEAMEADPRAGIIQTLPYLVNRSTLLARLQQFAAWMAGPVIATGLDAWSGRDGNYWGHNAIIRTRAFADHCGLPDLRGRPPLGGHVLSHDFVEAALIRRAGWSVYMLPRLAGSYEESPPSLIDLAVRDRRWCQGNLQHSRIIGASGLRLASRQHFATGIMAYLASPFWLGQLVVGIALTLQASWIRPEYFSQDFRLFPEWPRFDPERALWLFGLTMGILLAPKLFGLLVMLFDGERRRASGGGIRLVLSCVLEILLSALMAPMQMLVQSGSVFGILVGGDTGWNPQRRDDGSIPLRDIVRRHRWHTGLGVLAGISAFTISTSLFLWMSPTILGLILAIPLSWLSGSLATGMALKRVGLLLTPDETAPPPIVAAANALGRENAARGFDDQDALLALYNDPDLRQRHEEMLPHRSHRQRGEFEPDAVMAEAKIIDATTIGEAAAWLKPKERMVVLNDRALLGLAMRLKA